MRFRFTGKVDSSRHLSFLLFITLIVALIVPLRSTLASHAGYALQFDGQTDFVEFTHTAHILGPGWENTKTVSLWIKPTGQSTVCGNNSVAWCDTVFGDRPRWWGIARGILSGQDRIWVFNFDNSSTSPMDVIAVPYTIGEWVHIALVHENGVMRVYKNGMEIGVSASGATVQPNTGALPVLFIGGIIQSAVRNWTYEGQIDELRLYNTALSAAEIQSSMFSELSGSQPGLRAYYKMSNGSGSLLSDDSGNGWTGVLKDGDRDVPPNGSLPLWVDSGAFDGGHSGPTATPSATLPAATATATPTATLTSPPPTSTSTPTVAPPTAAPTATETASPPTATLTPTDNPPTGTTTAVPTELPPSSTPTSTPIEPSATASATSTPLPPTVTATATQTSLPPTATNTPEPTSTPQEPTPTTPVTSAGYALRFDGINDLVELPLTGQIFAPGWQSTKSVSLWVKPTGDSPACLNNSAANCDVIFGDRPRFWGIVRGIISGQDRIWVWNFDNSSGSPEDRIGIPYTPGDWIHITMVHDNGILRAFRNGVEFGTTPSGATSQPNGGGQPRLYIGGAINNPNRNWTFEGVIDEVRLYNRAVSISEVSQSMYAELTGNEPGLQAYYKMSNGSGTLLSDDSRNGWLGTLLDGSGGVQSNGAPAEWVLSDAFGALPPTSTPTLTSLPPTATATQMPPTATGTVEPSTTPLPPTATFTSLPPTPTNTSQPTATLSPPTATSTVEPSATPLPPTLTDTPPPTATLAPPTATSTVAASVTPLPPTLTDTPPPTATLAPPTATSTVAASATPLPPTPTEPPPPTETPEATATPQSGHLDEIGFYQADWSAWGVATDGQFAYIAGIERGLRIIDIRNPASPYEIGYYDTPGRTYAVVLDGSLAYLADGRSGLRIVDISNPANPIEIGFALTVDFAWGVAVSNGYAYVADRLGGLLVFDVTNPSAPQMVASLAMPDQALGVAVDGHYAYLSVFQAGGLRVVDISDPANPFEIGIYDTPESAYAVKIYNGLAYVADGGSGLHIFDVSNPNIPQRIGGYDTPGWTRDVIIDGHLAFIADESNGIIELNISNPGNPVVTGHHDTPGHSRGVAVTGSHVLVADFAAGVRILNR